MRYFITGGTGTLGKEITRQLLLNLDTTMVYIFSRDELKQQQMKQEFSSYSRRLKFFIGDVSDKKALCRVFSNLGVDRIFHLAALKHIDICQSNPEESVKTNLIGTINMADIADEFNCDLLFSSTDKAVDPINVYGNCKSISETILLNRNNDDDHNRFFVFRWGNIIASRGSVIHDFYHKIKNNMPITVTEIEMYRYWLLVEDAAKFMLEVSEGNQEYRYNTNRVRKVDGVYIPFKKMVLSSIENIIRNICKITGKDFTSVITSAIEIGNRGKEKSQEVLLSQHFTDGEFTVSEDQEKLITMIKKGLKI